MRKPYERLTILSLSDMRRALPAEYWIVRLVPADKSAGQRVLPYRYKTYYDFTGARDYLRHMNVNNYHVIGRPDTARHVLVDDVCEDDVDAMKRDGLHPSIVVETSRHNFQAWVTIAAEEVPQPVATCAGRILARRYGADRGSVGYNHLGRLPGFTNRKEMHRDERGYYWWARVHEIAPRAPIVPPGAVELLSAAQAEAEQLPPSFTPSSLGKCDRSLPTFQVVMLPEEGREIYESVKARLATRPEWQDRLHDRSRVDMGVIGSLLGSGFDPEAVLQVIIHGSEKARERGLEYVVQAINKYSSYNNSLSI